MLMNLSSDKQFKRTIIRLYKVAIKSINSAKMASLHIAKWML